MKKTLLTAVFALISIAAFSQKDSGFGIKGGLNYSANGDYFESIGDAAKEPSRNAGYHVGIYGKLLVSRIYLRPELVYTKTKSDYDGAKFDVSKLDLPVLVGVRIIGPLHIFAGPAFEYILNTKFDGIGINDIENDFTVGLNFGAGLNLGKLGIDIRYERGFSSNEVSFINTNVTQVDISRIDARANQLIVSLSLNL